MRMAHVHNDTNPNATYEVSLADSVAEGVTTYAPIPPATVGTAFAVETLSNRWNPANSWGNALDDFGLIELNSAGTLTIKGTGDYNGDGKNDILWRNDVAADPVAGYN